MRMSWGDFYPPTPRSAEAFNPDPFEAHALVTSLVRRGERVLEIGPSTGYITARLVNELGCSVVAVETSAAAAAATRGRVAVEVIVPPDELPGAYRATFDVILCADVIEHVQAPEAFLRQLLPYLRPGGRLVLSVPNVAHWTVRFDLARGRFDYEPIGLLAADHLRFFTRRALGELLDRLGCRVVSLHGSLGRHHYYRGIVRRALATQPRLIARLARVWPELFAFQFVVEAAPEAGPARRYFS